MAHKFFRTIGSSIGWASYFLACGASASPPPERWLGRPESVIRLYGDSTIRKYETQSTTVQVEARMSLRSGTLLDRAVSGFQELTVALNVADLKSGDATLDEHLGEAIKAAAFPDMRIRIVKCEAVERHQNEPASVRATGTITLAGVTRPLVVDGTLRDLGSTVQIEGEKRLLMTDFGIDPPTMLLGVVKTDPEIRIQFDLQLGPEKTSIQKEGLQ